MTAWYAVHEDGHMLPVYTSTDGEGHTSLTYTPDAPGRWSLVGNVGQITDGQQSDETA